MEVLLVIQMAELASDHHRNLAKMDVGKDSLLHILHTTLCVVDKRSGNPNIYEERGGVCEIAHTGIIRHHGQNSTVVFKDCRFPKRRVLKLQHHFIFTLDGCHRLKRDLARL
jgi:hypothetical protein